MFYIARFSGFGLELSDANLLLLHVSLNTQTFVLLLFQQNALESFRVFRWQLDVAQHDLFHFNAILPKFFGDAVGGHLADLLPPSGEYLSHGEVWNYLAK